MYIYIYIYIYTYTIYIYIHIYMCIYIIQSFPYENHCTANVTKSKYQDCGQCYLQLSIFFLYIHSPLLLKNKKLL